MKRTGLALGVILIGLSSHGIEGRVGDRGVDRTPPEVTLIAPEEAPHSFDVSVEAAEDHAIARVLVSVDGLVQATRLKPPFEFRVTAPPEGTVAAISSSSRTTSQAPSPPPSTR